MRDLENYSEKRKLFLARATGKSLEMVSPKLTPESVEMGKNSIPGRRNHNLKSD